MALVNELEKQGNFLFRYRGQIPVILFALAVPFIYLTDLSVYSDSQINGITILAIVISFLGFLVRAYTIATTPGGTSGRNTKEQIANFLNSTGIYSLVRHPLYLGNYLMWIGIVLFTFNIYFVIIVSLLYWLYYERIMFAEERFLEKKFGQEYFDWSSTKPAFIPRFSSYVKSSVPFSLKSVLRREYSGVLATVIGFVFVEIIRNYFLKDCFCISETYWIVLTLVLVESLVLRTLKKKTTLLNEEGRS
jgi:protein-S-isoprenylcysteine O-methyltransferase Ste14